MLNFSHYFFPLFECCAPLAIIDTVADLRTISLYVLFLFMFVPSFFFTFKCLMCVLIMYILGIICQSNLSYNSRCDLQKLYKQIDWTKFKSDDDDEDEDE